MKTEKSTRRRKMIVRVGTVLTAFAIACFSAGVSLISTGAVEQHKINNQCKVSYKSDFQFDRALDEQYEISRIQPCKGTVQLQLCQTSGADGTEYKVYVRKANDSGAKFKKVATLTCDNNMATSYVKLMTAKNSSTEYDVKVVKTGNLNVLSTLTVRYMLK